MKEAKQAVLKNLAMVCERYQILDRVGAAIGSAVFKNFRLAIDHDATLVFYKSKLRR